MDMNDIVTRRAAVLHILTGINAEWDPAARPAKEETDSPTDEPGEEAIFVFDHSDHIVLAERTLSLTRTVSEIGLHHDCYGLHHLWLGLDFNLICHWRSLFYVNPWSGW